MENNFLNYGLAILFSKNPDYEARSTFSHMLPP